MDMEENLVYEIRKGTINLGKEYEVSVAALYGILLLNPHVQDAWIATNADKCGDFDDVVVYWKDANTNTEKLFIIQCKHCCNKKKVSVSKFVNSKGGKDKDFFLESYVNSFNSILSFTNTTSAICKTIHRLKDSFKCILFTNYDADADEILEDVGRNSKSLSFLNAGGYMYKFKPEALCETIVGSTLHSILEENRIYQLISEVTLDKIIVAGNLSKQVSKIKMKELFAKEKFDLILKAKQFENINSANSKEKVADMLSQKLNKIISTSKLDAIIDEDKLSTLISKEKLNKSSSVENLKKIVLDAKMSVYISKEQIHEMVLQHVEANFDFISNRLFLLTSQAHNEKIPNSIVEELIKVLSLKDGSSCDLSEVVKKYMSFVKDWAQGKLGGYYLLTKTHLSAKVTELLLNPYMTQFCVGKCSNRFPTENINKWNSAIEDQNITLIEIKQDDDYSGIIQFLYCYLDAKIKQSIGGSTEENWEQPFEYAAQAKFYEMKDTLLRNEMLRTIGSDGIITLFSLYKALWKLRRIPLVLETSTCEDYQNVLRILSLSNYMFKVIIINRSQFELTHPKEIPEPFTNLANLNKAVSEPILEEMAQLQGRPIQLRKVIDMHEPLRALVTCRDIIHILMGNGAFTVGCNFNALPKFFIPRKISRVLLNIKKFVELLSYSKSVYVVKCQSKHFFFNCLRVLNLSVEGSSVIDSCAIQNENQIVTDYKIIVVHELKTAEGIAEKRFTAANIHYLILDDSHNLEWVKTVGSIDAINSCVLQTPLDSNTSVCGADALTHFSRQINIISASPGMGKTTIMDSIAYTASVSTWVLRINLNQHFHYYESKEFQQSQSNPNAHLEYFNKKILKRHQQDTPLNRTTFAYFLQSNSVLVLFDGFDEISPCYKPQVTEMVKSLIATHRRIWLTTRPALKLYVEKEFNSIAVTLNPLTVEDQVDFLTKYFMAALNNEANLEEVNRFARQLLDLTKDKLNDWKQEFTSVPLQTMLLAEEFTDECRNSIDSPSFSLNENFNLLTLYENFIQRKIQILADRYGSYAKQLLTSFEKYQQCFALKVVFSDKDLEGLNINSQLEVYSKALKNIEEFIQKDGIIVTLDGSHLTFAHRTFAEYFIAKWLAQNLKNPIVTNLIKKLFGEGYFFIRNMFDQILAAACPLHTFIINKQFDKAEELIKTNPTILSDRDEGGRLAAHLAASWGTRHPMPGKHELADANVHKMESHTDRMLAIVETMCRNVDMFSKDEIMGLTPLDYATATDCLVNMDAIISASESAANVIFNGKKIKAYLYYCARYGYTSLAEAVMVQVTHTHIRVRERLHTAASHRRKKIGHYLAVSVRYCYSFLPKSSKLNFVHINSHVDANGCAALHVAAAFGHTKMLTYILSCGANVNARDNFLHTALHYAVRSGSYTNASVLLSNGADIQAGDEYKRTPLHHACKNCGSVDLITLLLSNGADIHTRDKDDRTALHHAAKNGSLELVPYLLSKGADLEAKDVDKRTPIMHAAKNNFLEMVDLLISKGADVNAGDYRNVTALLHATARGYSNIVSLLLENGANSDTNDTFGQTVVDYSSMYENFPSRGKVKK